MQATAIGTVAVTIVLLGAFLFTQATVKNLGNGVLAGISIAVYLNDSVDDAHAKVVAKAIAADPRVLTATYVPKATGLRRMREVIGKDFDTALLTSNPFPNAFQVRTKRPESVPNVAARIGKLSGVAKVDYAADTVRQLLRVAAIGILAIARAELVPKLAAALQFVPFRADDGMIALELLAVGAAVGFIASWISVGRYLKA